MVGKPLSGPKPVEMRVPHASRGLRESRPLTWKEPTAPTAAGSRSVGSYLALPARTHF